MGRLRALPALALFACGNPMEQDKEALSALIGSWEEFDGILADNKNAEERDILLLSLAVEHPRHAKMLCKRTTGDIAREKCRQVLGRPHLGAAK